jgi:hypothetical protein
VGKKDTSLPLAHVVKQAENRPIHYCFNFAFNFIEYSSICVSTLAELDTELQDNFI